MRSRRASRWMAVAPGFYHTRLTAFDAQQVEGLTGGGIVFAARGPGPAESTATRLADGSFEIRWTVRRHGRQTFELARLPHFAAPLVSESGAYAGGVTVGLLEAPGRYYWRCIEEDEGAPSSRAIWAAQHPSVFALRRKGVRKRRDGPVRRPFAIEWLLMFCLLPAMMAWLDSKPGLYDANAALSGPHAAHQHSAAVAGDPDHRHRQAQPRCARPLAMAAGPACAACSSGSRSIHPGRCCWCFLRRPAANPEHDRLLAEAMSRLPVYLPLNYSVPSPGRYGEAPIFVPPIPALADRAAGVGPRERDARPGQPGARHLAP